MPTPTKGPRLGAGPAHERLMLAGLATQLFEHRRITTTEAKAKRVRPLAERMITFAKRGDLAARRRVLTVVRDKRVVHELFTEIAPKLAERHGGYTRITKIGPRKGDNAPMAVIELVLEPVSPKQASVREAEAATRWAAKAAAPAAPAAGPAEAEEFVEQAAAEGFVAEDTGVEDTGVEDTGVEETAEAEEASAQGSVAEDTGAQDTGAQDTEAQDTEAEDTEAEDTGAEDTGAEDTGVEAEAEAVVQDAATDTSVEDARGEA